MGFRLVALWLLGLALMILTTRIDQTCFNGAEFPCVKPLSSEVKTTAVSESVVEKPLIVDEPSEMLQKFQLEAIASSGEIRDALNDKALQELICRIDCSPNAENELDKAMAEEAFCLFTDKILSTINP